MKRIWKPLDVKDGLRLYQVFTCFPGHPELKETNIVAAVSPSEARKLIEELYKDTQYIGNRPYFVGKALNVYQPRSWWYGEENDMLEM